MLLATLAAICPTTAMTYASAPRTITDPIHHTIELHPLAVCFADTPEFQRLRGVRQLGSCSLIFPAAVHDRFQHSLGVAHLARQWAEHFQRVQPALGITDADVLCVTLAGLLHDLGHGPSSHFWEGLWEGAPGHETISCALIERIVSESAIDISPWLNPDDVGFIQALIKGAPPKGAAGMAPAMRFGTRPGILGEDKSFLYDIVANGRSGLDVDKLDYFARDSHFAGVVKVSFDCDRLMKQARVCRRDADGRLAISFPTKCCYEVLHVFQTRFALHVELYQHRVAGAIDCMLADAFTLADESPRLRVYGRGGVPLRLSECGTAKDVGLEGYLQLDDSVTTLVRHEARRAEAEGHVANEPAEAVAAAAAAATAGCAKLRAADSLLTRIERRQLYRFVGSVVLPPGEASQRWRGKQGLSTACAEIAQLAAELAAGGDVAAGLEVPSSVDAPPPVGEEELRADVRHVHYGRRAANPLDAITFFDNKQRMRSATATMESKEPHERTADEAMTTLRARPQPTASFDAMLPVAFEEVSLRLFLTRPADEAALNAARWAFATWCERQGLCDEVGCPIIEEEAMLTVG